MKNEQQNDFVTKRNHWETVVDALEKQVIEAKHQVFRHNLANILVGCREYVEIYEDTSFMPDKVTIYRENNQYNTDDSEIWDDPLVAIDRAVRILGGREKVKDYNFR